MPDTINGIQYGLEAVGYRVENSDGTYGPEKVINWPINLTLDFQSQLLKFYANDDTAAAIETDDGFSGSLEAMYFPDDFLVDVLGQVRDSNGAILQGGGEKSKYFAMHFMFKGDKYDKKRWACKCKATLPPAPTPPPRARPSTPTTRPSRSRQSPRPSPRARVTARPRPSTPWRP